MRVFHLSLLGAAVALAGCAKEVGVSARNASFGDALQANLFAQAIEFRNGESLMEMQDLFAAENDDTVNFAFNKSELDEQARAALDRQAAWLARYTDVRVRVAGHTDLVGGEEYNDRLGLQRARAVSRYLQEKGVARNRIDAVESRGEREPVVETEEKERRNRRSVTQVAGFTHGFIGDGMDGRRALIMVRRYLSDSVEKPSGIDTSSGVE